MKRLLILVAVFVLLPSLAAGDGNQCNLKFLVLEDQNGKPVRNASVVLHLVSEKGKQVKGGYELKTDPEGRAVFGGAPYGNLRVQVLSPGFQIFGEDVRINRPEHEFVIKLKHAQNQVTLQPNRPAQASPAPPSDEASKANAAPIGAAILRGQQLLIEGDLGGAVNEYRKAVDLKHDSSLAHYRLAEVSFLQRRYQEAANEYRQSINGDADPRWTEVWSYVQLGKIMDLTGQRERALNEYRRALNTNDNTRGALDEAHQYMEQPYTLAGPGAEVKAAPQLCQLSLMTQPGNVGVYVDDEFKGISSSEGRLVVSNMTPGSHRLRFTTIGYKELTQPVDLTAGESKTVEAKLEPAGPKPLELAEIEEALTNGLPAKGITKLVNQYGVDFALTKEIEQRLRGKGADDALLVAIATSKK